MFTATEYRRWVEAPTEAAAVDEVIAATRRLEREAQLAERLVPGNGWDRPDEWEPMPPAWAEEPAWMAEAMDVHYG